MGPGRAFRGARHPEDHQANGCNHQDLGHLRVRVGPVALPRHRTRSRADPDGARVLRHRRGGRQRGHLIKPGQFVIGSFFASDNTCPNCQAGYQTSCQHAEFIGTAQAPMLRVPLADGTLVATPDVPSDD